MLTNIKTASKKAMSIMLALVMCLSAYVLCNPFEAEAISVNEFKEGEYYYYPEGTQFISSIAFSCDDSSSTASSDLTNNGYALLQNSNPNRTGTLNLNMKSNSGGSTYPYIFMGYKTTTNINEALGTALRGGSGGSESEVPANISWNLKDAAGKTVAVPFSRVSNQDLNKDVGGAYMYLYYHDPADHGTNYPAQGLPIVGLKGWANANSDGGGHGLSVGDNTTWNPVYRNDSTTEADFDEGVSGAGYVYLFYDNASVYTNVSKAVNSLIAAINAANGVQDQSKYTEASWNAYKAALDEANRIWGIYNNVYKAGYVKEGAINSAVTKLNNAVSGLKTVIKLDATTNGGATETLEYEVNCGLNTTVDFPAGLYSATREGYSFLGWSTNKNASAGSKNTISVPLASTVYAIFAVNKYTVYFANPVTAQTISTQVVEHGKDAVAPSMNTFTQKDLDNHYIFNGWDKDFTNITSGLTVNAQFTTAPHSYSRIKFVPSTCTTRGTEVYKCNDCGQEMTVTLTINGANHNNTVDYPAKGSTCQQQGHTAYTYCNDCKTVVSGRELLPLAPCSWTDWTVTEPSCTVDGVMTRKCTVCGKTESETIPAEGHEWGDWTVVKEATCDAAGRSQRICPICKTTEVEIVNALSHNYIETVVPPTCTERGYTIHACDRKGCNSSYTDTYVNPVDHNWVDVGDAEKEATCTATGLQKQECTACHTIRTAVTEELGHDWQNKQIISDATCDTDGLMNATCDRCGDVQNNIVIPALGHDWDEGTITKPATCTEDGVKVLACKRENCGKKMDTVIKAKGHDWDEGVVTNAATCYSTGEKVVTCNVCFTSETVVIAKTNHKYVGIVVAPTCVDKGYTEYSCEVCNDNIVEDYVDAKGHTFSTTIVPPTCIKEGYTFSRCLVCPHTEKTNFTDALGHNYITSTVDPTCTEKGYDKHVCTRGDSEYKDNYVKELGHDVNKTVVDPTCKEAGYDLYSCSRCDYNYKENIVAALGHVFYEKSRVEPHGTQSGYVLYGCEECTYEYKEMIYSDNKGLVCVTIYDKNGKPVTEATITVTNVDTGESYVISTDLNGYFTEVLPEGEYELFIEREGYDDAYAYISVAGGVVEMDIPEMSPIECDCYCHQSNFWARIYRIIMKLRKFLGLPINCCDDPDI